MVLDFSSFDDYRAVVVGDGSVVLLCLKAYLPYESFCIDAYYVASNECFLAVSAIKRTLFANGIETQKTHALPIKRLACLCGLADFVGLNSLCYSSAFGSRIVFGAATVGAENAHAVLEAVDKSKHTSADIKLEHNYLPFDEIPFRKCCGCNACVRACPAKAIARKVGMDKDKCLRQAMNFAEILPNVDQIAGLRMLGCDVCQRVCPHNQHLGFASVPKEFEQALEKSRDDITLLAPFIGKNYVGYPSFQAWHKRYFEKLEQSKKE